MMPKDKKVLVVDDDSLLLASVAAALERAGFRVWTADSGVIAVGLASEIDFDVVVADMRMPGMDGLSLFNRLVRIVPRIPRMVIYSATPPVDLSAIQSKGVSWVSKAQGHHTLVEVLQVEQEEQGVSG
jgi:CheY-like chemotaxis protein